MDQKKTSYMVLIQKDVIAINERNMNGSVGQHIAALSLSRLLDALRESGYEIKDPPSNTYKQAKEWLMGIWQGVTPKEERPGTLIATAPRMMRQFRLDDRKEYCILAIWDSNNEPLFNARVFTLEDIQRIFELTDSL